MLMRVTLCRHEGRRLATKDYAAPVVGIFQVLDWDGSRNGFKRLVRYASLTATNGAYSNGVISVVPHLYDPILLPGPVGKIVLSGIELKSDFQGEGQRRCSTTCRSGSASRLRDECQGWGPALAQQPRVAARSLKRQR